MSRITLPPDYETAISEMGAVAALLDKNGWKAAAFIAVSVKPDTGTGRQVRTSPHLSARAFAKKLNAKGWSDKIITRYYNAWESAADAGLVPHADDLVYGERIELPTENWNKWYPPATEGDDRYQIEDKDAIIAAGGGSKAVDIAKNTKAMATAIKASPKVAAVAAAALEDTLEADELAAKVMSNPKRAQVALGNQSVARSVTQARASNLASQRTAHTPQPKVKKTVTSQTGNTLTLTLAMDEIRMRLNHIDQMIDSLSTDEIDILRDFLIDEVLTITQGWLDSPTFTGEEITPEAFGA